MRLPPSFIGVPRYFRALEEFGVGTFSDEERRDKCRMIRTLLKRRGKPGRNPHLSVIIPAHKEVDYLLATLRSLAEQTYIDAEFLIVSSGEPLGNLSQLLAEEAGLTVLHESQPGVGRARQAGLLAARGQVIVTSDADTLHHPDWLAAIAAHQRAVPSLVGGFGRVYALATSPWYRICTHGLNYSRILLAERFFFCAAEANAWFLREAGIAVGGYDVHAHYAEGAELFRKIARFGKIRCTWSQKAAVYTSNRRSMFERMKAMMRFMREADARMTRYAVVR